MMKNSESNDRMMQNKINHTKKLIVDLNDKRKLSESPYEKDKRKTKINLFS